MCRVVDAGKVVWRKRMSVVFNLHTSAVPPDIRSVHSCCTAPTSQHAHTHVHLATARQNLEAR